MEAQLRSISISCGERSNTLLIPQLCFVSKSLSRLLMAHCRILSSSLSLSVLLLLPLSLSFQSVSPTFSISSSLRLFSGNLSNARLLNVSFFPHSFSVPNPWKLSMEAFFRHRRCAPAVKADAKGILMMLTRKITCFSKMIKATLNVSLNEKPIP